MRVVIKLSHKENSYDDYVTYTVDATTGKINESQTIIHAYPEYEGTVSAAN